MTAGVVGVLAEALAQHLEGAAIVVSYTEGRLTLMEYSCSCGWRERSNWADGSTHPAHVASVVAALPNIAIVPTSGRIEVITHTQNGDLIAREIGTSRHIALAHIGSQPHSFANAPEALALKAEGYAALAARAAGDQA